MKKLSMLVFFVLSVFSCNEKANKEENVDFKNNCPAWNGDSHFTGVWILNNKAVSNDIEPWDTQFLGAEVILIWYAGDGWYNVQPIKRLGEDPQFGYMNVMKVNCKGTLESKSKGKHSSLNDAGYSLFFTQDMNQNWFKLKIRERSTDPLKGSWISGGKYKQISKQYSIKN